MDWERLVEPGKLLMPKKVGPDWAALIQQHVQTLLQAALPHLVQQVAE